MMSEKEHSVAEPIINLPEEQTKKLAVQIAQLCDGLTPFDINRVFGLARIAIQWYGTVSTSATPQITGDAVEFESKSPVPVL